MAKIQSYVIYGIMLDEIDKAALVWDNAKHPSPVSWPNNRDRAHNYLSYQDAWNRMQALYKEHKAKLNKYSFAIMETSVILIDDIKIDPQIRMQELINYFSPNEFKSTDPEPESK